MPAMSEILDTPFLVEDVLLAALQVALGLFEMLKLAGPIHPALLAHRRERDRSLSHRRLRAEPLPVMSR
jgi:hypothetical protein